MKKPTVLIIDSSVAVKWMTTYEEHNVQEADKILEDMRTGKVTLMMPQLAPYEIGNVLLHKRLTLEDVHKSLNIFYDIDIDFQKETKKRAFHTAQIAVECGITYYDASFISLAQEHAALLVTDNPKHQKKKISGLKVLSLKDYS